MLRDAHLDWKLGLVQQESTGVAGSNVYLDPQSMQNNGLYGCYYGLRATMLRTFGV